MRNRVLKSLIVCLNHESHARRGSAAGFLRAKAGVAESAGALSSAASLATAHQA